MLSDANIKISYPVLLHKHRRRTFRVYYNSYSVEYIYCADCKEFLERHIFKTIDEQGPIGVRESTGIS